MLQLPGTNAILTSEFLILKENTERVTNETIYLEMKCENKIAFLLVISACTLTPAHQSTTQTSWSHSSSAKNLLIRR